MDNFNASWEASSGGAFSEVFIEWFRKQSVLLLCSRHYSVVKIQTDQGTITSSAFIPWSIVL